MNKGVIKLNMVQDITLSDINDKNEIEAEKSYLQEQQEKLMVERDELAKEIAAKIGKLTFYYLEISRIDERLDELKEIDRGDDNAKDTE